MADREASSAKTLTVAICTRNRPSHLRRCLESIEQCSVPILEVLVSDDGGDAATRAVVEERANVVGCRYLEGPGRGLAANRNHCVRHARGQYLLFLDDDARLDEGFLRTALARVAEDTVVTGWEWQGSVKVTPHNADFLGFQRKDPGDQLRAVVINSTVFPTSLLRRVPFDEYYSYGYEELDMAHAAVAMGLRICSVEGGNHHDKAEVGREDYAAAVPRSRGHFGAKRYLHYHHSPLRFLLFAGYGLVNAFGHEAKALRLRAGVKEARYFWEGLASSLRRGSR